MMAGKYLSGVVLFVFIFHCAGCSVKQKPAALSSNGEKKIEAVSVFIPGQSQVPAAQTEVRPAGDPALWDFGRIKAGQIAKHEFTLTNPAQVPLTIDAINTSCGCAVPAVKKKSLLPGESTQIEVSFNSLGYVGPVEQYVYVHTDRMDNPVLKFTIKAEVIK
ncbi:MAG: DUF1573 domain-containing protein [Candidatus Omnitrophota bacterium]